MLKFREGKPMKLLLNRQVRLIMLLIIAVLLFGLAGCSGGTESGDQTKNSDGEVIELKLAHFFPSVHPAETDLIQPWAKAIEEATDGKVKIVSYPGQTLLQADNVYDGVIDGIADLGLSCFAYTRGRFPVLEAFELPGIIYKNSKVASKVAWEGVNQLNPQEVQDTKLMMILATGPGDLFTKVPIHTIDDLQGVAIRATGLSAKTLETLGASPVAMPQSEAYEALSKGVVQGNLGPVEVLKGWKNAEVTDYVTKTPFLYNTLFFITMNLDKWNSMSSEVQDAIIAVNEEYFEKAAMGLWDKQNAAAKEFAQENNLEFITLQDTEANRWIQRVEKIQDEYITATAEKGLPGEEALSVVKELSDKYNKDY